MVGFQFAVLVFIAPKHGILAAWRRSRDQKWEFAIKMLVIHLMQHEGTKEAEQECRIDHLQDHLAWNESFAGGVVSRAAAQKLLESVGEYLELTSAGRELATQAIVNI